MLSFGALATKVFGSANDRKLKPYAAVVANINALEPEVAALSDEGLRARTVEFRKRLADGETLDDLLPEAFATVREAAKRTLGQRHFDVQLVGGMVLHEGRIAEMKTGEGKTLVATLPVYLNALTEPRRARGDRQRLSRRPRRRLDGRRLQVLGSHRRHHRARHERRAAQGAICLRRHLRHQQRVRLRLSARQHEIRLFGDGAARPLLRHRRRGRLDPHRRGAHPAHHFRSARRPLGFLHHDRRVHSAADRRRFRARREDPPCEPDRGRQRACRAAV